MNTRRAALPLLAAAAAALAPPAAHARTTPAACDVVVGGFAPYRGPCAYRPLGGGSFALGLTAARPGELRLLLRADPSTDAADDDSVQVRVLAPGVALLFGIGGAHQTGAYLATLHRQGACWTSQPPADAFNGRARVCVRRD